MKIINVAIWGPFVASGLILSCCIHIFFTVLFIFSFYLPYNSYYSYHLIPLLYKVIRLIILSLRSSLKYIRNASWGIFRRSSLTTTSGYNSGEATPKLREIAMEFPDTTVEFPDTTVEFHDDRLKFHDDGLELPDDRLKFHDDGLELPDDGLELDDNRTQESLRPATPFPSLIVNVSEEHELNSSGTSSISSYQTVLDECCNYVSYVLQYSRKFFQRKTESDEDDDDSSLSPTASQMLIYEYTTAEYENLEPPPTFFQKAVTAFNQVMVPLQKIIKFVLRVPPFSIAVKKLSAVFREKQYALEVKWNSYLRRIRNALYVEKLQNNWQRFVGTVKTISKRVQDDYHRMKAQVEQEAMCPGANNINEQEISGICKEPRKLSISSGDSVDSDFVTPQESPDEDEWQEATSQHDCNLPSKEDKGSDAKIKPFSFLFRKVHYIAEKVRHFGKWSWNHVANLLNRLYLQTIRRSLAKVKLMLLAFLAYPSGLQLKVNLKKRNESKADSSHFSIYKNARVKRFALREISTSSDEREFSTPLDSPNQPAQLISISYCKDQLGASYVKSINGTKLGSSFETTINTSDSDDATEQ